MFWLNKDPKYVLYTLSIHTLKSDSKAFNSCLGLQQTGHFLIQKQYMIVIVGFQK